jgi:dipeptidyl-peptidase-4
MRRIVSVLSVSPFLFISPIVLPAQDKPTFASIREAVLASFQYGETPGPRSVNWMDGGDRFSYLPAAGQTGNQTAQDQIMSYDPATGEDRRVLGDRRLTFPGTKTPFSYESFQWSGDSRHLMFKTNVRKIYRRSEVSDFYLYSIASGNMKPAAKAARSAGLSPDGAMAGIVRNGNMYACDFASAKEVQLTRDGGKNVFNGYYDWVYEEEFGKAQAWNWSPDSKYIAYWQFDERKVPVFQMTNYEGMHPEYERIPIPDPGDPNPSVRIGVVDVHTHKNVWLKPDETGDYYIPRIYWTSDPDVIALMTLNRAQNHMKLYFFNVRTGAHHVVLEEKNDTWVAIFNFYTSVDDMVYFPAHSKEFFWVSDRSGYYHVYRYGYDGKLINQVTGGNWDLIKVTGIDPVGKTLYYLSAEASPLEQQLYSVQFDGSGKRRLTRERGYHDVNMSPNTRYYLDTYSNIRTPQQVTLCDHSGKVLKLLADGRETTAFLQAHALAPTELFHFVTSDGAGLDGSIVKPLHFDSTKQYPIVLFVYGGPESHDVFDQFKFDALTQWLAQNGYIVASVNNRGEANYGRDFMKIVYRQLGKWESHDFAETARYLGRLPYADSTRMAIMGTSYGGYSTTYTMLTHPDVFKAGIANSPVTDWRLYDDIYTERYMGPLKDNEEGYVKSADMTYASALKGHLLLIHSMYDENVHPAHTMQLLTALTNAGKDVDLRIYPLGAHGAAYDLNSYILINNVSYQYLERYLKGANGN